MRGRLDGGELAYFVEQGPEGLPVRELEEAARRSAGLWNAVGAPRLRPVARGETPDLVYRFLAREPGAPHPFGGDSSIARAGPVGRGSFVELDGGRAWTSEEIRRAVLHETGHVLGLEHVQDERSVMNPGLVAVDAPGAGDVAGIRSLYGGGGPPGDADLVVRPEGSGGRAVHCVVRAVAPPSTTDFAVFDVDGDGASELVVWRTDEEGAGALLVLHFDAGPVLARIIGPSYGMVSTHSSASFAIGPAGERLLVLEYRNGKVEHRRFVGSGRLEALPEPLAPLADVPRRARSGDLDGDGRIEVVGRVEGR